MSAKSNKIELSEEFMAMWREEQTLWNVMFQARNQGFLGQGSFLGITALR